MHPAACFTPSPGNLTLTDARSDEDEEDDKFSGDEEDESGSEFDGSEYESEQNSHGYFELGRPAAAVATATPPSGSGQMPQGGWSGGGWCC